MQKPLPCPPQPSLSLGVTCDPLPYSPWPPWAYHASGALTVHLGAVCPTASTLASRTRPLYSAFHGDTGPPAGLLEGQGKMTVPDQFRFLGGHKGRELGHLLGGWGQGTQTASPALPLTVTSGRLLSPLGPLVYPALRRVLVSPSERQGQWPVLRESTKGRTHTARSGTQGNSHPGRGR